VAALEPVASRVRSVAGDRVSRLRPVRDIVTSFFDPVKLMTRSHLRATFVALFLGALLAVACDDGAVPPEAPNEPPPQPVPGDMVATLVSPNGAEGAAVFESTSETIRDVSAETGDLFFGTLSGSTRIIVVLETPGEIRFTLAVDDVNEPPSLRLIEVADGDDVPRRDLRDYSVQLEAVTGGGS
jgi:hypothetical protein